MKINVTDIKKITDAINEAEGKAQARTLNPYRITSAVEKAERQLNTIGIPKKYWEGCTIYMKPEKVPNSYRSIAHGTFAEVKRFAYGWFLVNVYRGVAGSCSFGEPASEKLSLSVNAKAAIPDYEL